MGSSCSPRALKCARWCRVNNVQLLFCASRPWSLESYMNAKPAAD